MRPFRLLFAVLALGIALAPAPSLACAACYGQSSDPLASGMNWGIFTLLGVVVTVLGSFAGFFIYLIRREAAQNRAATAEQNLSEVKI